MQTCTITVNHVALGGFAFGFVSGTDESVFIPVRVAQAANVVPCVSYTAKIVPNVHRPEVTPHMAIYVEPAEGISLPDEGDGVVLEEFSEPPLPASRALTVIPDEVHIGRMALEVVEKGDGTWTAQELARELADLGHCAYGARAVKIISQTLLNAHRAGRISAAAIFQRPGQRRASRVRFALDWRDL